MRKREGHVQRKGSDAESYSREMWDAGCESKEKVVTLQSSGLGVVWMSINAH